MGDNNNKDIIYFTLFPWDNEYSSVSLSFTREFSKANRVFYINHPYSLKDYWRLRKTKIAKERRSFLLRGVKRYEKIPGMPENVIGVHPPLTIPINWLPRGKVYDFFAKINKKIILRTIKEVIAEHGVENYIYLNCYDPFFVGTLPRDEFNPLLNIYQCIDDFAIEPYSAKHGLPLEDDIIKDADVVTVTSSNLVKLKKPLNENIYLVPNAVELSIFGEALDKDLVRPAEIAKVTTKIIGFTGNMDAQRMDMHLIKKVAEYHSDKTVVLVGPVNNDDFYKLGIDRMPNVIATGAKNIRELPAFLQHFDVALIPFQINVQTASIYPLKINEYLAAGKAVVSTSFSEDIKGFADWIYLAKDENEFMELIDRAIEENSDELVQKRLAKAKTNTWTERVKTFWEIVEENLK